MRTRSYGVTAQDRSTQELARRLQALLRVQFGVVPHLVISHLHRRKLDPNRDIVEAAQGDKTAEQAWREYHGFIDRARKDVSAQWGQGLYLDLHGHGHPTNWVEIGYLLGASELSKSDSTLRSSGAALRSSIRTLSTRPGNDFARILRGANSLGSVLSKSGFRAVPSPRDPSPGALAYFQGGYSTKRHGSLLGGTIDGIQLEHPWSLRRDARTQAPYLNALVRAVDTQFASFRKLSPRPARRVMMRMSRTWLREGGDALDLRVERDYAGIAETFTLATDGSALPGRDFVAPSSVRCESNERVRIVSVRALADAASEGVESLRFRLGGGPEVGDSAVEALIHDAAGRPRLELALALDEIDAARNTTPDLGSKRRSVRLLPSAGRGPRPVADGRHAQALRFDGVDDALEVQAPRWNAGDDFSVAFWFRGRPRAASGYQYLMSFGAFSRPSSLHVWFAESTKTLRTSLAWNNDHAAIESLDAQVDVFDGAWHHYVLIARKQGLSEVWLDGRRAAASQYAGDRFAPVGRLLFGQRENFDRTRAFAGSLDEVRISSRALSRTEIAELFAWRAGSGRELGPGCGGLAGLPALRVFGSLDLGSPIDIEIQNAPAMSVAVLPLALSHLQWGALRLPLALDALGAPGCALRVSLDFPQVLIADARGDARLRWVPPFDKTLIGAQISHQALVVDRGANRLGFSFSNATRLSFGGMR